VSAPRVRLDSDQLRQLLAGEPVRAEHRGSKLPERGEPIPAVLHEETGVRAIVMRSQLRRRAKRIWLLDLVLDRSAAPMLLAAESQAAVTPLGVTHDEISAEAHGYTENEALALDDAGEAIPYGDIVDTAESQQAAMRFAGERIDELARRRARSLGARTRDALLQARAHGVDPSAAVAVIEEQLRELEKAARSAAA
jgi:hypothetical protein